MNKGIFIGIGTVVRMACGLVLLTALLVWNALLQAGDALRKQ
ncbi:hypothetical protein [Paraburkholderia jirisanensis]